MKLVNSIAALALYALTVSFLAVAEEATAGVKEPTANVHNTGPDGSPAIVAAALNEGELAETLSNAGSSTKSIIERAQTAFAAQLSPVCEPGTNMDWIAEDAVYQYALTGIDVSLRMEGRDVITKHLCALSTIAADAVVQNVSFFPTLKPDLVYVQYDLVRTDGTGQRSNSLAVIEMRADQIVNFRQLSRSPGSVAVLKSWM